MLTDETVTADEAILAIQILRTVYEEVLKTILDDTELAVVNLLVDRSIQETVRRVRELEAENV